MAKLNVERTLRKAISHERNGQIDEACKCYDSILELFPGNIRAKQGLAKLSQPKPEILVGKSPSKEILHQLLALYNKGEFKTVTQECERLTEKFPQSFLLWNLLGAALKAQGKLDEAIAAFNKALLIKPDYADAHNNLGNALRDQGKLDEAIAAFNRALLIKSDSADAHNNLGNALRDQGKLDEAIAAFNRALLIKSDSADAYNNMGNALRDQGKLKEAIAAFDKGLLIKPDYADAHNNMGIALRDQGKLKEAIAAFYKGLLIKPDYAKAHYNMGVTLYELGRLEEAEASYRQAIVLKSDYAEAHSNLGVTLQEMGRLEEAIASYECATNITPNFSGAKSNLVACLTSYSPEKIVLHPIAKVNQEIRKIRMPFTGKEIISDSQVIELFSNFSSLIKNYNLDIETKLSQIYRRNSVDLNCKRHTSIFEQHNIIPKFCFGCYKVQVEPNTILELIKLFVVFDQLKLEENNTRKCMVELRPEISGFYKGLVFCSGLNQAIKVKEIVDIVIKERIRSDLSSKIKRGCSEYPISFPDYQEINISGPQLMNYNEAWNTIEENHDRKHHLNAKENQSPTLSGLNLEDVLIIRKWTDYARGIGDPNINLLGESVLHYPAIYKVAQERLEKYQYIS